MLDKIKEIIANNKNIDGYKIIESKIESNELFFVKKNIDMDRGKKVHNFMLTVYKDFEENEKKYKGSSTTNIFPTMSEAEIEKAIDEAAFAAQFAKNPYYPLAKPESEYRGFEASNFSKESLSYWMNEIAKAVYKNDNYEKGGVNSCEIFLNKVYTHIVSSEGIDVDNTNYQGMVEFITTWKEEAEEIELYKCLNFSDFDGAALADEVQKMITACKEKAVAKSTPVLEKSAVLLTGEAVKTFFDFYSSNSNANSVYTESSTWKVGDKIQGESVKGDLITMTLNPFMKGSTFTRSFDEDGFALKPVTIIEKGILKKYSANTRFAHYLEVEPTGAIKNKEICGGSKTISELKKEPYLEAIAFSDFTVDEQTGDFCGEIRLAWYFDGEKTTPVTGGSISGNISELHNELYLSKELQKDNEFEGPEVIKLLNVTVAGIQ